MCNRHIYALSSFLSLAMALVTCSNEIVVVVMRHGGSVVILKRLESDCKAVARRYIAKQFQGDRLQSTFKEIDCTNQI
jgi:IMP dehydrogenase/GMP reductase